MKRFLLSSALLSTLALVQAGTVADYAKASMDTLNLIDTFTASIKPILSDSDSADGLITSIKGLYSKLNVVGSSGFAYAF